MDPRNKCCDSCYHGHQLQDIRIYNRLLLYVLDCFEYRKTRAHSSHISGTSGLSIAALETKTEALRYI